MKNVIKYIVVSLIVTIMIVTSLTNIEALNYTWSWGGNRASWTFSDSGYVYPSHSIHMKAGDSIYLNGVTLTSGTGGGGSGDVVASGNNTLTGNNTFSNGTTFSDSLRANGYSIIDDAKITTNLRVTGDVITDLNFNKGSLTNIGTISTDTLALITNNTQRVKITKDGKVLILDSLIMSSYDIFPANGMGLNWSATGDQIYSNSGSLELRSENHNFFTTSGYNVLSMDSANGMTLNYGTYTGNGSGLATLNAGNLSSGTILQSRLSDSVFKLSNLDTTRFLDQSDTSKYFRLGDIITPITEIVNSLVTFSTTVTFTVSPVFSALVNFANGITVTGTATFNGDLVPTSWVKTQSSATKDQYIKDKFIRMPISTNTAAGTVTYTLHGLSRGSIRDFDIIIRDDSTGRFAKNNAINLEGGTWSQGLFSTWGCNDTAFFFRRTGNAYNFIGDTAFFHVIYADTTR